MNIEIVNKEGDFIAGYELESNPFKVGEIIHIKISNYDKQFWDVAEVNADYRIDKIEHFLKKTYTKKCHVSFTTSIEVTKID